MRLEPRACRPPFRHDRNEQVERREVRTEKPRRAGLRLHYLPKPPRSLRLLARHKPSGNVGIGVRRVDVGNHGHQLAQELRPGRRGNEIALARGLRQIGCDRRALGHDLPVGQHQRRELHQRIDRAQLLAGRKRCGVTPRGRSGLVKSAAARPPSSKLQIALIARDAKSNV
jgi:hypothetical protein